MWSKTHSITVASIEPEQIWKIWADANNWPQFDDGLEWTKLDGKFETGGVIYLKPKGGPKVTLKITECIPNQTFTDYAQFPLARMYDIHRLEKTDEGLRITNTITITGPLAWLWRKLVAEKVAAEVPKQTESLIRLARTTP